MRFRKLDVFRSSGWWEEIPALLGNLDGARQRSRLAPFNGSNVLGASRHSPEDGYTPSHRVFCSPAFFKTPHVGQRPNTHCRDVFAFVKLSLLQK
jgi:hypothetical protein